MLVAARPSRRTAVIVAAVVAASGCVSHPVGQARTFATYEDKAATTAEAALSAVSTTLLAAHAGTDGLAWGTYLSVLISEQEDTVAGVQGTFASIQPPDQAADDLRDELDAVLASSVDHVADVRIVARRGRLDDLAATAAPLEDDQRTLEAFVDAHR